MRNENPAAVVYRGISEGVGHDYVFAVRDGIPEPLRHYERHSKSFAWGYGGSGPSDLARCILADFLCLEPMLDNQIPEIESLYHQFKFDHIATLPDAGGAFELSGETIAAWLEKNPLPRTCSTCRTVITQAEGESEWCMCVEYDS